MKFYSSPVRRVFLLGGLLAVAATAVILYKNDSSSLNRQGGALSKATPDADFVKERAKVAGPVRLVPVSTPPEKQVSSGVKTGGLADSGEPSSGEDKNWDAYHPGMKIVEANIGAWLADPKLSQEDLLIRLHAAFAGGAESADVRAEALTHWLNLQDEDHEKDILGLLKPTLPDEIMSFLILRDSLMRSDAMQAKVALALLASDSELIQKEAQEQLVILTNQNLGKKPEDWADYLSGRYKKIEQP